VFFIIGLQKNGEWSRYMIRHNEYDFMIISKGNLERPACLRFLLVALCPQRWVFFSSKYREGTSYTGSQGFINNFRERLENPSWVLWSASEGRAGKMTWPSSFHSFLRFLSLKSSRCQVLYFRVVALNLSNADLMLVTLYLSIFRNF
jgi:hypothetical protein